MNIKLRKIIDLKKSEQTDEVKREVYSLIKQFVYKNHRHYYPHFQGNVDDLIMDLYAEFLTDKLHRNGEEFSELDRFDPGQMGGNAQYNKLATYVKTFVVKSLIDAERSYKGEVNYAEKYDEDTGQLSIDFLANLADEPDVEPSQIEFTDDFIETVKHRFDSMDPVAQNNFLQSYEEVKSILPPNFKELFAEVVGNKKYNPSIRTAPSLRKPSIDAPEEVKAIFSQYDVQVSKHKYRTPNDIKVYFSSKEDMAAAAKDKKEIQEKMKQLNYEFAVARGQAWYFVRATK